MVVMPVEEKELIAGLKRKEEGALAQIMGLWGTKLLQLAYLILKDHQLAEDVTQEAFVNAYRKIHQLEGDNLLAWLTTITTNLCRQRLRKWSWSKLSYVEDLEDYVPCGNGEAGNIALAVTLKDALLVLPIKYREVLLLFYYFDYSLQEIGKILGEKEGTIKSRLSRGREKLKEILGREDF